LEKNKNFENVRKYWKNTPKIRKNVQTDTMNPKKWPENDNFEKKRNFQKVRKYWQEYSQNPKNVQNDPKSEKLGLPQNCNLLQFGSCRLPLVHPTHYRHMIYATAV
jgi:hypothetical protein